MPKYPNALFIVEVHLAIKLVHRHSTFHNLKETIETNFHVVKKGQPFGHIEWMVKLGPITIPAASGLQGI